MPKAKDIKVFVPNKNFQQSLTNYQDLGWKKHWSDENLAEMELGNTSFYLQAYYQKGWANNPSSNTLPQVCPTAYR